MKPLTMCFTRLKGALLRGSSRLLRALRGEKKKKEAVVEDKKTVEKTNNFAAKLFDKSCKEWNSCIKIRDML